MTEGQSMERFPVTHSSSMTLHATARLQQRAVPSLVMSLLLDYGSTMQHAGAEVIYVDKKARRRLREAVGGNRNLSVVERWLNSYVVLGEGGRVVTVARRTKRLRRL